MPILATSGDVVLSSTTSQWQNPFAVPTATNIVWQGTTSGANYASASGILGTAQTR